MTWLRGEDFLTEPEVRDVFVIGGGINGCGIARDAAGRGYSVFLAEMNDFGSGAMARSARIAARWPAVWALI